MGGLGRSLRERPSPEPKAARRAVEATGKAVAVEIAGEAECNSALATEVVDAGVHFSSWWKRWRWTS